MFELLAVSGWVLDLVFFLILLLGTALGAFRGFIKGISKLAGKFFSIIFAVMFCVSFANFLELCFGMTTAITTGIAGSVAKNEAYAVGLPAVAGSELGAVLKEIGVGAFPRWIISCGFGKVETIPAGTTAAVLIASVLAKWISVVIAFIALIIILRVGVRLIAKIFSGAVHKVKLLRVVDQFLGAILGALKAGVFIFIALLLCNWLPIASLHEWIESSLVVGKIFASDWFQSATSFAVSGEWLTKHLSK